MELCRRFYDIVAFLYSVMRLFFLVFLRPVSMDNDNDNEVIVETGRKTTKTSLITAYSSIYMTDIEYLYSWGTNFARNFLLFF